MVLSHASLVIFFYDKRDFRALLGPPMGQHGLTGDSRPYSGGRVAVDRLGRSWPAAATNTRQSAAGGMTANQHQQVRINSGTGDKCIYTLSRSFCQHLSRLCLRSKYALVFITSVIVSFLPFNFLYPISTFYFMTVSEHPSITIS